MLDFLNESELTDCLERTVDTVGINRVLSALADICSAKSEHIEHNWQDRISAKIWQARANFLAYQADSARFRD